MQAIKRFFLCLILFHSLPSGYAQVSFSTPAEVPDPKQHGGGYISDPGGILEEADRTAINNLIAALEASATVQIAVAILPSIGEENPKDFATRLFNEWGVGQSDKEKGLLVLTVMDQRRTEFETGYGLEAVLPDILCYRIGMQYLVPKFKEEAYGAGILEAIKQFKIILENPELAEDIRSEQRSKNRKPFIVLSIYGLITAILHIFVIAWIVAQLSSQQDLYNKYIALRKVYSIFFLIFFPMPYALLMWFLRYKLKRLREGKRYSKISGKPMMKLSEEAEDKFLTRGQVSEEEIGSVDYDVWVAEDDPEDILILRYEKRWSSFQKCPKCQYKTYHQTHSRVIQRATYHHSGKQELTYTCENCHYKSLKIITIPKKSSGGGSSSGGGGGSSWGGGSSGGGGGGVSW